jgi:tetratricopeptide (TPR) repeat protein
LRSKGKDTTISEAFTAVEDMVQNEVREDYPGARQTPVLKSKWKGDELVLAVRPASPQVIPQSVLFEMEPDSTAASQKRTSQRPAARDETDPKPAATAKADVLRLNVAYFSKEADPRKAYEAACQAVATHKGDPDYAFRKAKVQIQLGKWGSAMQELKGVIIDNPQVAAYYLARAYCFHKLGQEGNADADLRTAKFLDVFLPPRIEFED